MGIIKNFFKYLNEIYNNNNFEKYDLIINKYGSWNWLKIILLLDDPGKRIPQEDVKILYCGKINKHSKKVFFFVDEVTEIPNDIIFDDFRKPTEKELEHFYYALFKEPQPAQPYNHIQNIEDITGVDLKKVFLDKHEKFKKKRKEDIYNL